MIQIARVIGHGRTKLSAFDNALFLAGIHNRNLIYLSSVIPEGETVKVMPIGEGVDLEGRWGDKLYVVMAYETAKIGETASAGVAYAYDKDDEKARGLFVEHEAVGDNSLGEIEDLLITSLSDLFRTRGLQKTKTHLETSTTTNKGHGKYACPMVVAVFEEEGWNTLGK